MKYDISVHTNIIYQDNNTDMIFLLKMLVMEYCCQLLLSKRKRKCEQLYQSDKHVYTISYHHFPAYIYIYVHLVVQG